MEINEKIYADITSRCLEFFNSPQGYTPLEIVLGLIDHTKIPMHCPEHHYLLPAALLTATRKVLGDSEEMLLTDLTKASERARNVLGGFCGLYGACGAAVGTGIFTSILTSTSPHSTQNWDLVNRITGEALIDIAAVEGPRCCKRNTFFALLRAEKFLLEHYDINIGQDSAIKCHFCSANSDCKQTACPFFPQSEV